MTEHRPIEPDESPYRAPVPEPAGRAPCPDCHAEVPLDAQTCWMCGREIVAGESEPTAQRLVHASPVSFSLASLMTIVTLVAIGLGLFVSAPGLGILYCVVMVPALVRTAVGVKRTTDAGQPMTLERKFQLFATSLAVTIAAGVATVVAFFATCFSACFFYFNVGRQTLGNSDGFIIFASILAGSVALIVYAAMFYLFRTKRRK